MKLTRIVAVCATTIVVGALFWTARNARTAPTPPAPPGPPVPPAEATVPAVAKVRRPPPVALGKAQVPSELKAAHGTAVAHLKAKLGDLGLKKLDDLGLVHIHKDAEGTTHSRVQQTYQGVPVFGGDSIVHVGKDGKVMTSGEPVPGVGFSKTVDKTAGAPEVVLSVVPKLTAQQAIERATARLPNCAGCAQGPESDLNVFRHGEEDRLAYRVRLERMDGPGATTIPVTFIDAETGEVLWSYDDLQTAAVTSTGTSTYYGNLSLGGFQAGTSYYLEDTTRKLGTFDYKNTTTTVSRSTDTDNVFNATNQKALVDIHYGLTATYDYFKTVHGRNGIDGNGGPGSGTSIDGTTSLIGGRAHYSTRYNNAFWNGQYMTFGDGDGTTSTALTSLDVTAHELTHGVTERSAGLVYSGESGALNESMSDVFGAMVERRVRGESANTWKIGEDCYTPATAGDAIRRLDDPHADANGGFTTNDNPDHYSERYTGTADNGGVHVNSGIPNKAFYLVAKGGTHHLGGTVTGIGADAAAKIWYRALTAFMTSSTNFAGARTATLNAAANIYGAGSAQGNAVCAAWAAVGVGAACGTTQPPPPPPAGTESLVNGGFEGSVSPWVRSGTGALYVAAGNFPQAGTGYSYFGSANSVTGQTYQQFTIPAGASKILTFYLNVTSAETTTTSPYDKLFVEVRNSAGTLLATLATYSNLNKVAAGGTYAQKSFSLAAYAGQTIRLQFRATTDSSAVTTFRVDTVSVK